MNAVAAGTRHFIPGVSTRDIAHARGLIPVTLKTGIVSLPDRKFQRIANVGGSRRFCVNTPRAVARFAGLLFPTVLSIGFHNGMGVLQKGVRNLLVTTLTDGGSHVFRFCFLVFLSRGKKSREQEDETNQHPEPAFRKIHTAEVAAICLPTEIRQHAFGFRLFSL
jgi:hypothetical protein